MQQNKQRADQEQTEEGERNREGLRDRNMDTIQEKTRTRDTEIDRIWDKKMNRNAS